MATVKMGGAPAGRARERLLLGGGIGVLAALLASPWWPPPPPPPSSVRCRFIAESGGRPPAPPMVAEWVVCVLG
jgi:hypothetical protein